MPSVTHDGHGGAIVVWNAFAYFNNQPETLIACRADSSGTKLWETVVRIDTTDDPPFICSDGLGGVIIAWSEGGFLGPVRVQRIDSGGAIKWDSAGVLACTLSTVKAAGACIAVDESCFVVGFSVGPGWHDRAQMFDLAGNLLWGPAGVPVAGTSYSSSGALVLPADDRRQSTWVWAENRTGKNDIFAQRLDAAGARCWDSAGVWLGTVDTSGGLLSAMVDGRGGAIAVWTRYRRTNWGIYAQHIDSAGSLRWSDTGLAVTPVDCNAFWPAGVIDGDGGAIIAWLDDRGLYAQRVADGAGIAEAMNDEREVMNAGPTVVRGVLVLGAVGSGQHAPYRAELLDVSGRTVMNLKAGANDVRRLAPGVYFVCEGPRASSRRPLVVRKVVITG